MKKEECPECGSKNIIEDYENGEIVCQTCGLILNDRIISEWPEWRAFTKEVDFLLYFHS